MIKNFTDFIFGKEKKGIKNKIIIAVGILLMIILLIGEIMPDGSKIHKDEKIAVSVSTAERDMGNRLEDIIKNLDGIENVKAEITLESTDEYVYAKNSDSNSSKDSKSANYDYIYSENSADELSGLVISVKSPKVKGVAVICTGGDNPIVKQEIIKLVSSLYSVGSDCIYVGNYKG